MLPSTAGSKFWKSGPFFFFFFNSWFFWFLNCIPVDKICVKAVESQKSEQKAHFWTPFTAKSSYSQRKWVDHARNMIKLQLATADFISWIYTRAFLRKSDLHACSIIKYTIAYGYFILNFTLLREENIHQARYKIQPICIFIFFTLVSPWTKGGNRCKTDKFVKKKKKRSPACQAS